MTESQQLREQMWDLIYGLLSTEESQSLIAHIKSDPQAARLYAECRLQADLVGQAARVEDSSLVLRVNEPAETSKIESRKSKVKTPASAKSRPSKSSDYWLAGIAAIALVVLLAAGLFWSRQNDQQLASAPFATDIEAPSSMPAGLTNKVAVRTYFVSHNGRQAHGAPIALQVRLLDAAGKETFHQDVQTGDAGWATVEIPGA